MITLKSQKYEVFNLIEKFGLDPSKFKWTYKKEKNSSLKKERITYNDPIYYLSIRLENNRTSCDFSPGLFNVNEKKNFNHDYMKLPWAGILECIKKWLISLKRELEVPDIWDKIGNFHLDYESKTKGQIPNKKFSKDEIEKTSQSLENIRAYLIQLKGESQEHLNLINEKIDYLIEASKRMGRKDWIHVCIGAFTSLMTGLALSPEKSKEIWSLLREGISFVVRLLT